MLTTRSSGSKAGIDANKSWRSALRGACERIRNTRAAEIHPGSRPQVSNVEILDAALRVREQFKNVEEGNAQMLLALADFKNRRRKMQCERGLLRPSGFASAMRP